MRTKPYTNEDLVEIIGALLRGIQWRDDVLAAKANADAPWRDDDPALAAIVRDRANSDAEVGEAYLVTLANHAQPGDAAGAGVAKIEFIEAGDLFYK